MPGKLEGRTALVTGGGRGIGEAICRRFAEEGARVAVADIDADTAAATSAGLPVPGLAIRMDVSSTRDVREGVGRVAAEFGRLDILVNNAGYLVHTKVHDCSEEEWDKQIDINLKGMFFCSQAALNLMVPRRRGVILSMSSLAAKNGGLAASAPYAAAKGAIFTLTITLARYAAPHGIRVNAMAPGVIDTPMTRGLSPDHADLARTIPLGEKGQPEDVAACALFLASDDARHITGETVDVNGGLFMD
ncbi:MAG: SDR family NAD(P)-dependent oxidoreductase [Gemmatimonadetes bacterium]|nr:SDR family NAD(P)-dependent oxidoreductase [Gemmatimonadota bacterium]